MTSQLPCSLFFFLLLAAEKKTPKNGADVMSLRPFLFCDNFNMLKEDDL